MMAAGQEFSFIITQATRFVCNQAETADGGSAFDRRIPSARLPEIKTKSFL